MQRLLAASFRGRARRNAVDTRCKSDDLQHTVSVSEKAGHIEARPNDHPLNGCWPPAADLALDRSLDQPWSKQLCVEAVLAGLQKYVVVRCPGAGGIQFSNSLGGGFKTNTSASIVT